MSTKSNYLLLSFIFPNNQTIKFYILPSYHLPKEKKEILWEGSSLHKGLLNEPLKETLKLVFLHSIFLKAIKIIFIFFALKKLES